MAEDFDGVLEAFDQLIGVDRIKVVHVNDSKNPQGAKRIVTKTSVSERSVFKHSIILCITRSWTRCRRF
ncbi:endonuclease IV [Sporolactobacillus inulinus]|uniref:Endonuclease IV n=1 Tax=Sporolactobacillus inulinus TaxID=2078 RepID=A0A4Y1ZBL3_9BACL|nr:endonuclease IV [Sporolactobacillus inulinus]